MTIYCNTDETLKLRINGGDWEQYPGDSNVTVTSSTTYTASAVYPQTSGYSPKPAYFTPNDVIIGSNGGYMTATSGLFFMA